MQQIVYTEDLEDKDVVVRQLLGAYDFDDMMEELRSAARHLKPLRLHVGAFAVGRTTVRNRRNNR